MELILNILSLIFVFVAIGFCIFSHELGHFLAAKWRGLHIDAFSIGFRPFWKKKINGVEYRLGWLPFGGYVELPQVDATDAIPKAADGTELPRAKPLDRIITAVAGPLFNIISGLLIACFVWWIGLPQDTPKMREVTVLTVDEAGPEWKAGLRPGDKIVKINGEPFFSTWREIILNKILLTVGTVEFEVIRDGKPVKVAYIPAENPKAPEQLKAEKIAWPFFTIMVPIELHPKAGSPAEKAGIKNGDILISIDGNPITDFGDYQSAINAAGNKAKPVTLKVQRGGQMLDLAVIPALRTDHGENYRIGAVLGESEKEPGILVSTVLPDSPAQQAGFLAKDRITKLNGETVRTLPEFIGWLQTRKSVPSTIEFVRNGKTETLEITPETVKPYDIGIELALTDHPTPFQQLKYTVDMSYKSLAGILVWAGNKLGLTEKTSSIRPTHMSGPLGMGMILFTSVRTASFATAIYFIVIISFALAIFNLFPLPVLDGGHTMFGLIEIIFRRPLPTVVIKTLSTVFVVLLIGLMIFVTLSDGRRLARNTGLSKTVSEWFSESSENPAATSPAPTTEANDGNPQKK